MAPYAYFEFFLSLFSLNELDLKKQTIDTRRTYK